MISSRAVILGDRGGPLIVDDIEVVGPGPREAVVRIHSTGVCHSQVHFLRQPRTLPMLLGHEATGVVVETGSDVTRVGRGDAVLVAAVPTTEAGETIPPCPRWRWRGADHNGTDQINVFTWSTVTVVDERNLVVAPTDLPLDVGSVLGCAAVTGCGSVMNLGDVEPGSTVGVFGVGGVGLFSVVAAVALGAAQVIAVDIASDKLALARSVGATAGIDATTTDVVEAVLDLTGGQGVDCAVDAAGACTMEGLAVLRAGVPGQSTGGTLVMIAMPEVPVTLPLRELLVRGRRMVNSLAGGSRPQHDLPIILRWFQEGRIPLEAMVTRRYGLEEVNDAVEALQRGETLGRSVLRVS